MHHRTVSTRLTDSAREALEHAAEAAETTRAHLARILLVQALRAQGYDVEDDAVA